MKTDIDGGALIGFAWVVAIEASLIALGIFLF